MVVISRAQVITRLRELESDLQALHKAYGLQLDPITLSDIRDDIELTEREIRILDRVLSAIDAGILSFPIDISLGLS